MIREDDTCLLVLCNVVSCCSLDKFIRVDMQRFSPFSSLINLAQNIFSIQPISDAFNFSKKFQVFQ